MFHLRVKHFVGLFGWLSDNPGLSVSRVCADDFGVAMAQLSSLRTQASILRLAKAVAGLRLQPCKCVIIVSCIGLLDEIILVIREWLKDNVPEFTEFDIACSGKYLGWYLGVDSVSLSYGDPLKKFISRVHEVTGGKAPAATSIIRYNPRAVLVVSYVSQFASPATDAKLAEIDQWSVHKILRMPPNPMSGKLSHSVGIEVDPVCLGAYRNANLLRFANSESAYLLQLHARVSDTSRVCPRDDNTALASINAPAYGHNLFDLPSGGPILVNLFNAIKLSGRFSCLNRCFCASRQGLVIVMCARLRL